MKQALTIVISCMFCINNLTGQVKLKAINHPFQWLNKPAFFVENPDSSITFSCKKGETLFNSPFGELGSHNCPMLLFEPSSEFVFSAKVSGDLLKQWDAAQLIVWSDSLSWAKIYLERAHYGKLVLGSILTKITSDDCNGSVVNTDSLYLQIARIKNCIFFYSSTDGRKWTFHRAFNFSSRESIKIGFSCESTFNDSGTNVVFSDIKYKECAPVDMFNGL